MGEAIQIDVRVKWLDGQDAMYTCTAEPDVDSGVLYLQIRNPHLQAVSIPLAGVRWWITEAADGAARAPRIIPLEPEYSR